MVFYEKLTSISNQPYSQLIVSVTIIISIYGFASLVIKLAINEDGL